MINNEQPYDVRRNLEGHTALPPTKERNCNACADVTCLHNTTAQAALRALEENPMTDKINQWTCDDTNEDPIAANADLKNLDQE